MKITLHKTALMLAIAVCLSGLIFSGCGKAPAAPVQNANTLSGKVVIYTSMFPDIIEAVKPELKKAFPNLEVVWFQAGTEQIVAKLAGEIEAKKIGTDLLMVSDPAYYITLKQQNLLMKYDAPNRQYIPKKYRDEEGYWTGVRLSYMLTAYNTNKVRPEDAPKSFKDLTDSRWKDRIGMANPLLSGSIFTTVADLSGRYGWDYFKTLNDNGLKIEGGNTAVQNKLLTGEYFVGIIGEENILKLADKGEAVKVAYPQDGAVELPSPIAIFNTTQNPEAAKAVLNWWLSKEGQQVIVDKGWMHSVRDDVAPPKGAPDKTKIAEKSPILDWGKLAQDTEKIKQTFKQIVLDR